jgi:hypothetical protein
MAVRWLVAAAAGFVTAARDHCTQNSLALIRVK